MISYLNEIISSVLQAQAQAPGELPPPSFAEILVKMAPMFLIVYLIFYFMVIKPQQTKLKNQAALLEALKKGDQVVTTGGIVGRVSAFEEDCIVLDLSNNVRLKVERAHIIKRREVKPVQIEKVA